MKSPTKTTDWIADPSSMLSRAVRNDLMDALAMVYHPIVDPGPHPSATEIAYRQARALEKITIGPVTFVCDPTKDLTPMTNPVQAVSVVFFDSAGSATNSVRQYTYRHQEAAQDRQRQSPRCASPPQGLTPSHPTPFGATPCPKPSSPRSA